MGLFKRKNKSAPSPTNELICDALHAFRVPRSSITNLKLKEIDHIISKVKEEIREKGTYIPWLMTLDEYGNDSRALFEISEVRGWAKHIIKNRPYFAAMLIEETLDWFLFCVLDFEIIGRSGSKTNLRMRSSDSELGELYDKLTKSAVMFFAKPSFDEKKDHELVRAIAEAGKRIREILNV